MAKNRGDITKQYEALLSVLRKLQEVEDAGLSNVFKKSDAQKKIQDALLQQKALVEILNDRAKERTELSKKEQKFVDETTDGFKEQLNLNKKNLSIEKQRNQILSQLKGHVVSIYQFFMQSDEAIRNLNRELGLSGERAEQMRQSIQGSAISAANLGGSIQDLANIQSTFADETGRAKILAEEAQLAVMQIGLGTGLGVEQAARLAGQFELMGLNAQSSANYVQGIVDTTERMGVNTNKVLKSVSENFRELQSFTFREGVKGFAKMASYAEKFKVDMGSMLDSADKARTLEGAVDLAAQLQVMGGEFAKTDPFEILFLARNDPAKYAQKINQMTKGVAQFRKNAEGTFETFISPMDIDRLERVGESLGMQRGELAEQARRMAEIQRMRQQMIATGLGDEQKEIIEGLAQFDSKTGKFFVKLNGAKKELSKVTSRDAQLLEQESRLLEDRAKDAKTFDKVFQDTVITFKSALLPILDGMNDLLANYVKPTVDFIADILKGFSSETKDLMKVGGKLAIAGIAITGAVGMVMKIFSGGGLMSKILSLAKTTGAGETAAGGTSAVGKAARGAGRGGGFMSALGKGAGIGTAAVGIGAGVKLAAEGFSELAKSMKDLNPEQLASLERIMLGIGIAVPVFAGGLLLAGKAAEASAIGIAILTGAIIGIGFGINLATEGIASMASQLGNLEGLDLTGIAGGLAAIGASSLLFANPLAAVGALGISTAISSIAASGDGIMKVGEGMKQLNAVMSGDASKLNQIKETLEAISNLEVGNNSVLSSLAGLFSQPLRVEFSDKEVAIRTNVTLNMDGHKVAKALNIERRVAVGHSRQKEGKEGAGMNYS